MGELVDDLNYDFNYNMFLSKTMLTNLTSLGERTKTLRWMRKLSMCNRSINEMKLRNDFMYYLVLNVQNGELIAPFNENPPSAPLRAFAHLLPGGDEVPCDMETAENWGETPLAKEKPMLYQNSPDGGAFLAAQPIPRCGAFCYLAVVSRPKSSEAT